MDMSWVEVICLVILVLGVALRSRAGDIAVWRNAALPIACAALVAEDSCIRAYAFYDYAPAWHGFDGTVPLLVGLIWVFVVLSARDMARAIAPQDSLPIAFLVIAYDAALIEPIATHCGLWRWHEAGPFAVPWIGMLGWAFFGASALFWLEKLPPRRVWLLVLAAPLTTHALLLIFWWGCFRWVGRHPPLDAVMAIAGPGLAVGLCLVLWRLRRAGRVPLALIAPRIAPALFFFGLLALQQARWPLWCYAASFALPWLAATRWKNSRFTSGG